MADLFASRETLPGGETSIAWDNTGYGTEAGDPPGRQATAWFTWVCPAGLTVATFSTAGSSGDSYLHVYDSALTLLGSDDDSAGGQDGAVTIAVTPGQSYEICASMWSGDRGWQVLNFPDPNPAIRTYRGHEYILSNVGLALVPEDEGYEYLPGNVGLSLVPEDEGYEYVPIGDVEPELYRMIKVWDGTDWVDAPLRYWNGKGWLGARFMNVWDGDSWQDVPGGDTAL